MQRARIACSPTRCRRASRPARALALAGIAAASLVLAGPIAGQAARAQESSAKDKDKAAAEKASADKPQAEVTDSYDVVVKVSELGFYEPSSGMLSSGKATQVKELRLWHGAHELLVDLGRVARIDVHLDEMDDKNDLVWVTVTLRSGESQKAKVERALELRGTVPFGRYKIRIDRAKRVVFGG